jgi:hypothetical protein
VRMFIGVWQKLLRRQSRTNDLRGEKRVNSPTWGDDAEHTAAAAARGQLRFLSHCDYARPIMSSGFNPYAPPTGASHIATPETPVENVVTCTFLMTAGDMAQGLALSGKGRRMIVVAYLAFLAFSSTAPFDLIVQIASVVAVGAATWFVSPWLLFFTAASRSLANKSEGERTLTWRFSPDGYELTTSASLARGEWWTLHRVLEGRASFLLFASEVHMYVIPKSALRVEDVPILRAMFAKRITPRKQPMKLSTVGLWFLLIFMFLAVWQFLQSDVRPPLGGQPQ